MQLSFRRVWQPYALQGLTPREQDIAQHMAQLGLVATCTQVCVWVGVRGGEYKISHNAGMWGEKACLSSQGLTTAASTFSALLHIVAIVACVCCRMAPPFSAPLPWQPLCVAAPQQRQQQQQLAATRQGAGVLLAARVEVVVVPRLRTQPTLSWRQTSGWVGGCVGSGCGSIGHAAGRVGGR